MRELSRIHDRAGDSAHSFPPTGGLGLNSGLADVHNLAYKLAAIHQNWGGPSLLSTYHSERRQVALVNSQQSVKNGQQIFGLLKTLGTTDSNLETAKRNLFQRVSDPNTRPDVLKGVEAQREHFDNLGLHIGYVYGDTKIPASASLYVPSYRAGARLPHAWLTRAPSPARHSTLSPIDCSYVSELDGSALGCKRFSTLDICAFDAFTLIFSSTFTTQWSNVLSELRSHLPKSAGGGLKINASILGEDFELVAGARRNEWIIGLQLEHGAAVLVKPDQHMLNCYGVDTKVDEVAKGLTAHLGL